MWRKRFIAFILLWAGAGIGFAIYQGEKNPESIFGEKPFKYGLDIQGGTELVYEADTANIAPGELRETMAALRDVIERRVNLFGVSEPVVQTEEANALSGNRSQRLIVELPGVTDIEKAVELIGQTPLLEFKIARPDGEEKKRIQDAFTRAQQALGEEGLTDEEKQQILLSDSLLQEDPNFIPTPLT